ncbi:MAG: hypothetical protein F2574_02060 [Actinobacteria bacterium]|uniref:Unannotated protein n=1 Tax=freshwater metagenome TaxID=449393 RepID=A0A6J6FIG5_9ZZZZ|nr:hypothetical protein [Actinomycetota bacterium]
MADNYGDDLRESLRQFKEHLSLSSDALEPRSPPVQTTSAVSAEQLRQKEGIPYFVSIPDRA